MCLYSRLVLNPKYKKNKKNGGNPPAVYDDRIRYIPIGCGKCIECKRKKQREWKVRLCEEILHNKNGKFVTLTFNNESLERLRAEATKYKYSKGKYIQRSLEETLTPYELDNAVCGLAVRYMTELYRKHNKKTLRHWLITELGHHGTERIHMHGIIWIDDIADIDKYWKHGWTWKGKPKTTRNKTHYQNYVTEQTINYCTKYVLKTDNKHKAYNQRIFASNGIGANYIKRPDSELNVYKGTTTIDYYKTKSGHKLPLPNYYRNKIYSEYDRERLWLHKLDEEVRYVNGRKYSIKNTHQDFEKALIQARITNASLGYGTGDISDQQKDYEHKRRVLLITEAKTKWKPVEAW